MKKRIGRPKGSKNKTKGAKRAYKRKSEMFPIEKGLWPAKSRDVSPTVTKAVSTVLHMTPKSDESFVIPNNKENGIKLQSIYWSARQQLKKINKNISISTQTLGPKGNPTGLRIWRIN